MNYTCKALKIMPCPINIENYMRSNFVFWWVFFFFFFEVLLIFKNLSIVNLQCCARCAQILKHPTK